MLDSFLGSSVQLLKPWLDHQPQFSVAATPLAVSTPSDHDSPNAPATARSVYVFAHTAVRPPGNVPSEIHNIITYNESLLAWVKGYLPVVRYPLRVYQRAFNSR